MSLNDLRLVIDEIDKELVALLNSRSRYALDIGIEKRKNGVPVQDTAREDKVLSRVRKINDGPLSDDSIEAIYKCIISESLELQKDQEIN